MAEFSTVTSQDNDNHSLDLGILQDDDVSIKHDFWSLGEMSSFYKKVSISLAYFLCILVSIVFSIH